MTQQAVGPEIDGLRYLAHLGSGGYSDVFLYERQAPRMRVAVKVLKDARLSDAELAQFAAEAETMAQLADHPYIVQVFTTGALLDGRPYLVMKYYPPPNLGARAAHERFSVSDVLRTGIKVASAVETAHRAGILHRDIKPANILVSQYGEPGLTDFGIAGHAAETEDADDLGVSIPWSPPEVLSGTSNGSARSDVYSLGATVWHLLGGRSPFEVPGGDNAPRALMARVLRGGPPPTGRADVPPSLERLLGQAMAKSPAARPRSALEFAQGLQAVEQEQRFPRTDIVVQGFGAPSSRVPQRPAGGEQTRLKAPVRVAAQGPAAKASLGPGAEPPTMARPAIPLIPASVTHAAAPPATATVHRATASVATPPDVELAPRRRGPRKKYLAVIAAAVVAVAIVLGVVLASRSGSHPRSGGGSMPAGPQSQAVLPAGSGVAAPIVTARYDRNRKMLTFRWTISGSSGKGSYLWYPAADPGAAKRTTSASLDVSTSRPATLCIRVQYIDSAGTTSPPSAVVCG